MSRSKALQRQEYILHLLARDGAIEAEGVAAHFGVSIWTIRRDMNTLAAQGALERRYGGALRVDGHEISAWGDGLPQPREPPNLEAKQRIGRAAARLVHSGNHIVLSGGTTTLEAARALRSLGYSGEVVTNALDIAQELAEAPEIKVVCTGGDVQRRYHTLAGSVTERMLRHHFFDVALIGISGIALREGITVISQVEAATLSLMIEHSRRVILLADHSKFGRVAFASLELNASEATLVTDAPLVAEYRRHFAQQGVQVVVAPA